jgi:hypothetical protein
MKTALKILFALFGLALILLILWGQKSPIVSNDPNIPIATKW